MRRLSSRLRHDHGRFSFARRVVSDQSMSKPFRRACTDQGLGRRCVRVGARAGCSARLRRLWKSRICPGLASTPWVRRYCAVPGAHHGVVASPSGGVGAPRGSRPSPVRLVAHSAPLATLLAIGWGPDLLAFSITSTPLLDKTALSSPERTLALWAQRQRQWLEPNLGERTTKKHLAAGRCDGGARRSDSCPRPFWWPCPRCVMSWALTRCRSAR